MKPTAETVTTIDLGPEQLLIFDGGPQSRVRVLFGAAWLTEEGQAGDSFVGAGGEEMLHGGRAVVEGLAPTRLQLVERPWSGRWHPLRRRLRQAARELRQWLRRSQFGTAAAGRSV